jgi:Bifunctional DNA primase/polymerase, N-terminal/Primase C terminal 1 (PriCT-1)
MSLLDSALAFAGSGISVFPLSPGTKIPLKGSHGCLDSTTDPTRIRDWWENQPEANIAIATGAPSGLIVVDLDGLAAKASVEGRSLPRTPHAKTPRGFHIYLRGSSNTVPSRVAVLPGVDIRAAGGYVVAPPSQVNSWAYTWLASPFDTPLADPPEWLSELLQAPAMPGLPFAVSEQIPEGERRYTLWRLARSLKAKGLAQESIAAAIRSENQLKCDPPLDDAELRRTLGDAWERPDRR